MIKKCEVVRASEIRVGDVIDGPDGSSTVSGIRLDDGGYLCFDFAEGRGNRCWTALRFHHTVTRLQKTECNIPGGFAVGHDGQVMIRDIGSVIADGTTQVEINIIDGGLKKINRSKISHIIGNFTLFFK
ncbi:MAG: hypothetical protein ABR875_02640 [Minisyncoccia bacterium]|jgi:hypothetical protein